MMRCTVIMRWTPEKTPDVMKRFGAFVRGEPPEVVKAYEKIKQIAWEFPSFFGQLWNVGVMDACLHA